ncbi:MAG: KpsF/GutQ family sugar-phosphate isomerase [Bacteroidia bacterium]
MQNLDDVVMWAVEAIGLQANAVSALQRKVKPDFKEIVFKILQSNGRLIITGIGKSAAIANKIVATLNSTGTPSIFMHAADAVHGDLGIVQENDIVICISKSGNTPEIKAIVPIIKKNGNLLIGMVGNLESYLAMQSDYILDTTIEKEACPNNLAPTTSTTAQLVMGDALAICLLKARGFTSRDFAKYHPGGSLGKKLYTTLADLSKQNSQPQTSPNASIKDVIVELSTKRLGAVAVLNNHVLVGIITDGDIRRMLENHTSIEQLTAKDIMNPNPTTMQANELAADASLLMAEKKISQVIILDNKEYVGMVHIHDLNREGIF